MPIDYTPKSKTEDFPSLSNKYSKRKPTGLVSVVSSGYNPRETKKYPSLVTPGAETSLRMVPQYTGTEMIGVTILHKSCLQPVFNQQAAKDAASMRR